MQFGFCRAVLTELNKCLYQNRISHDNSWFWFGTLDSNNNQERFTRRITQRNILRIGEHEVGHYFVNQSNGFLPTYLEFSENTGSTFALPYNLLKLKNLEVLFQCIEGYAGGCAQELYKDQQYIYWCSGGDVEGIKCFYSLILKLCSFFRLDFYELCTKRYPDTKLWSNKNEFNQVMKHANYINAFIYLTYEKFFKNNKEEWEKCYNGFLQNHNIDIHQGCYVRFNFNIYLFIIVILLYLALFLVTLYLFNRFFSKIKFYFKRFDSFIVNYFKNLL